jgi:FkbM family methyltransferase
VEACKQHYEFMITHFQDNGLDPLRHRLIHGVVGITDGEARFPVLADPAGYYGERAIFGAKPWTASAGCDNRERSIFRRFAQSGWQKVRQGFRIVSRGSNRTAQVQCLSLSTLLGPLSKVDLLHVDIQGDEYDVLASARRLLQKKVKRLVIGTHGRDIEQKLFYELAARSMVLESEEACHFSQDGSWMKLQRDGCQVWRNPALM